MESLGIPMVSQWPTETRRPFSGPVGPCFAGTTRLWRPETHAFAQAWAPCACRESQVILVPQTASRARHATEPNIRCDPTGLQTMPEALRRSLSLAGSAPQKENESSVNAALAFDKNDQGLFFISDRFAEYNQLAYKNLNTEEITVISKDISWDVDGFAVNEKGDRAAFVVNENGYSALYLLNPQTFKYKKVKSIPIGLIGGMEFKRNNKSLGLTINTFQSPSDAHVLDLRSNPLGYGSLTG